MSIRWDSDEFAAGGLFRFRMLLAYLVTFLGNARLPAAHWCTAVSPGRTRLPRHLCCAAIAAQHFLREDRRCPTFSARAAADRPTILKVSCLQISGLGFQGFPRRPLTMSRSLTLSLACAVSLPLFCRLIRVKTRNHGVTANHPRKLARAAARSANL